MGHRSEQSSAVFVDASGRRSRFVKYAAALLGVSCVLFLGAVVAGLSGSGPAGGSLPWSGNNGGNPPVRAEHSPTPTGSPSRKPSAVPAAADKGAAESATPAPSPSVTSSAPASGPAPTPATSSAPAPGNGTGSEGRGTPAEPAATGKGRKP